jgi:hypothetical protein
MCVQTEAEVAPRPTTRSAPPAVLLGRGATVTRPELKMLESSDLDVQVKWPDGLLRIVRQGLEDLTPWHVMPRDLALKRLDGLRQRYSRKYVPIAYRQDNDGLACIDPARPDEIVIVHDFASEGSELRQRFSSFWDWFRAAVEDMVLFE